VITGFNTDVEHDGIVYHVQTEDKGLESPIILSLVYTGGTILASKRSPYEDLIASGYSDEALAERLKRQHRLICAAIHSGRIDDLKKMSRRAESGMTGPLTTAPLVPPQESVDSSQDEIPSEFTTPEIEATPEVVTASDTEESEVEGEFELDVPAPVPTTISIDSDIVLGIDEQQEMIWELLSKKKETEQLSKPQEPEPEIEVQQADIQSDESLHLDGSYPVLDERGVGENIPQETGDGVVIKLLDENEFFSGELRMLRVFVSERHGEKEKALINFPVSIKILGTAFRPLIFSVKTERDGVASVQTEIPQFTSGRAAVLIRVVGKDNTAELRRVIHPSTEVKH
jgi:hypothetical protein